MSLLISAAYSVRLVLKVPDSWHLSKCHRVRRQRFTISLAANAIWSSHPLPDVGGDITGAVSNDLADDESHAGRSVWKRV